MFIALHCHNIGLASPLRLLIFRTPSADGIAKVRALVMYLSVIAHAEEGEYRMCRLRDNQERSARLSLGL
jgi:hypothetical protein